MTRRALLYARQSDSAGEGDRSLSLDSQLTVLRADAARCGWVIVGELRDADLKGYDERRPGLLDLYDHCRAGSVDIVAFWKLDRLARLLRLQENVLHELASLGVEVWSNQDPHLGNPLFRQMLGAFNEEQTRIIAANVRRAVRERTRRGIPHGPAPFGYQRGPHGRLEPSADAETVQHIFRWRTEDLPLLAISARLHAAGIPSPTGRRWSRQTLAELLVNPVYVGTLHLAEVEQPDAHEAIINSELFHTAQQSLVGSRQRVPRSKPHRSWLEGAIVHACGAPMYLVGGSPGRPVLSFRCRVGAGWGGFDQVCAVRPRLIRMDRAEALTWRAIMAALGRLPAPRTVLRNAQRRYRLESPTAEAVMREMERQRRLLLAERERWLYAFTSGAIGHAQFDRELARIQTEEGAIAARLAALPVTPSGDSIALAWSQLRALRDESALIPVAARGRILRAIGVAEVSPAGVPIVRLGPGRREDAGCVTLRPRPELAGFFGDSDT